MITFASWEIAVEKPLGPFVIKCADRMGIKRRRNKVCGDVSYTRDANIVMVIIQIR
jgi:hypothetical protein